MYCVHYKDKSQFLSFSFSQHLNLSKGEAVRLNKTNLQIFRPQPQRTSLTLMPPPLFRQESVVLNLAEDRGRTVIDFIENPIFPNKA